MQGANGPTEFSLASHMWGQVGNWSAEECYKARSCDVVAFDLPAGSIILSDYRTVHRGTRNDDTSYRPMAMFVYGRDWWSDTVNYDSTDYGGFVKQEANSGFATPEEKTARLLEHVVAVADENAMVSEETKKVGLNNGLPGGRRGGLEARKRMFWGLVNRWESGVLAELDQVGMKNGGGWGVVRKIYMLFPFPVLQY